MPTPHEEILAILREGKDMTLATLRPDGAPHATTVSYASDGIGIYFGCGEGSQKARNLAHDERVSLTIDLPYADWSQIRGLSIFGRAQRVTDPDALMRVAETFLAKFPEVAQYIRAGEAGPAMFRVTPELVSILNYAKGFGNTELVRVTDAWGRGRVEPACD